MRRFGVPEPGIPLIAASVALGRGREGGRAWKEGGREGGRDIVSGKRWLGKGS